MKRTRTLVAVILTVGLLGCGQQSSTSQLTEDDQKRFTFTPFTEEVDTPDAARDAVEAMLSQKDDDIISDLDALDVIIDKIINIGKKIWTIVEKGKPVVNIKYDYANALPKGVRDASDLDNFSDLQYKSYRMYAKNLYGMTVYDVTYTIVHQYGGDFDGKGKYLATVSVIPSNVSVLWGYTVNYGVQSITTLNVGSKEAPVASMAMELKFKASTIIKSEESTTLYQFRGDKASVRETR